MSYRLGVDVGGTFTDLLLISEETGETYTAKVPSTPEDSSIGVLDGVARICEESGVDPAKINRVMHGTTVATNAVLQGKGAKVGLVTTKGYEQTLQVARSFCPGGLGGWVTFNKNPLLAPLELTIGADERMDANGGVIRELDEAALRKDLAALHATGEVEALTICFVNAYINGANEVKAAAIAREVFGDTPISVSSEVVPEMQEYERTETTVMNSYVRPEMSIYVTNLQAALKKRMGDEVLLSLLRSDGGLASGRAAAESPVNMLMSGPAGGVTGAIYFCSRAGFDDILTFDMGGTSTDVALIQDSKARVRRETTPPVMADDMCFDMIHARELIRAATTKALEAREEIAPLRVDSPITLEIELQSAQMADVLERVVGVERLDGRNVRVVAEDMLTIHRYFLTIITMSGTVYA